MNKKTWVYGWTELNDCSYGRLEKRQVDTDNIHGIDEDTQILSIHGLYEGVWFPTFQAAKKAAIGCLKEQIEWSKLAISEYRRLRKKDVIAEE